jgi:hypothetical protein
VFRRALQRLSELFLPFASIAQELRVMNELKELELANRIDPRTGQLAPIYRVTETPGRKDTEVTFMGDEESNRERSVQEVLANALEGDED